MKFKRGDTVRLIRNTRNSEHCDLLKGAIGKIVEITSNENIKMQNQNGFTSININGIEKVNTWKERLE